MSHKKEYQKLKKPKSPKENIENIIFFDTESILKLKNEKKKKEIIKYKEHTLGLLVYSHFENGFDNVYNMNHFIGSDKEIISKWHDYILSEFEKIGDRKSLYIASHNAKYDTLVTQIPLLFSRLKGEFLSISFSNPFLIIFEEEETKKKLIFFSTTNIFNMSLKKLGKVVGQEKIEYEDFSKIDEETIQYCYGDVEVLNKAFIMYWKWLKTLNCKKMCLTVASQALYLYKSNFMQDDIYIHHYKDVIKAERECYRGARTEVFKKGYYKNLIYLDYNSMYPSEMQKQYFPTKYLYKEQNISLDELKNKSEKTGYLYICRVYVNMKTPKIGIEYNKRMCFPLGKFWCTLTKPEIDMLDDEILKIQRVYWYEKGKIFEKFVDFFYAERQKMKAEDNPFEFFYKIIMNSLYGKFGQRDIELVKISDIEDIYIVDEQYICSFDNKGNSHKEKQKIFCGHIFHEEKKGNAKEAFVAIAAYVTAYGRCKITKSIMKAGFAHVWYCDTDSIITDDTGFKLLDNEIDNKKLGFLGIEHECINIQINNLKDYILEDVQTKNIDVKKKGLKKGSKQISENEYITERWEGYSDFIHSKTFDRKYRTYEIKKKYKTTYNKGIETENGEIKPFILNEPYIY